MNRKTHPVEYSRSRTAAGDRRTLAAFSKRRVGRKKGYYSLEEGRENAEVEPEANILHNWEEKGY